MLPFTDLRGAGFWVLRNVKRPLDRSWVNPTSGAFIPVSSLVTTGEDHCLPLTESGEFGRHAGLRWNNMPVMLKEKEWLLLCLPRYCTIRTSVFFFFFFKGTIESSTPLRFSWHVNSSAWSAHLYGIHKERNLRGQISTFSESGLCVCECVYEIAATLRSLSISLSIYRRGAGSKAGLIVLASAPALCSPYSCASQLAARVSAWPLCLGACFSWASLSTP